MVQESAHQTFLDAQMGAALVELAAELVGVGVAGKYLHREIDTAAVPGYLAELGDCAQGAQTFGTGKPGVGFETGNVSRHAGFKMKLISPGIIHKTPGTQVGVLGHDGAVKGVSCARGIYHGADGSCSRPVVKP
jgi:hypothetical protein